MVKYSCCECDKKRERCKPVVKLADGEILWCCPACFKHLDMDLYLYEHRLTAGS